MRRTQTKKPPLDRFRVSLVVLGLSISLVSSMAYAQTTPYFKTFGGDVFTGGWFDNGLCSSGSEPDYQDPLGAGSLAQEGGIAAYTKSNAGGQPQGGSSSELGVFSLGLVDGGYNSQNGFYSNGAAGVSAMNSNKTSFANSDNGSNIPFGGRLQGNVRQGHCIPDYYVTKNTSAAVVGSAPDLATSSGQYIVSSPSTPLVINSSNKTIAGVAKLTIFVDGNAYIGGNITYSGTATVNQVPKFALIVKGSIYIGPNVTNIDGVYIAQPNPATANPMNADTGIIWTCHPNNSSPVPNTFPNASNCHQKLIVNGALIAKQVNFIRTNGDIGAATAAETAGSANIAEEVNYTPAMVIGGPFFNPPSSTSLKIQSLINLPPVF